MRRALLLVALAACKGGGGGASDGAIDTPGSDDAAIDGALDDAPIDALVDIDAPLDAMPPSIHPPTGHCDSLGWCWVLPLPQGNPLGAIAAVAPNDVWAIGQNVFMHYDGTDWTPYPVDTASRLPGRLIVQSPTEIWSYNGPGLQRFDGTAWTTIVAGSVGHYDAIGAEMWVQKSGTPNTIVRWNGTATTSLPLPATAWSTVAFFGTPTEPWALASDGRLAKWLGTTWGVTTPQTGGVSTAAAVIDATHVAIVYATFQVSYVRVWDGVSFTDVPGLPNHNYKTIAARAVDDIWTCSVDRCSHWDGVAWTEFPSGPFGLFDARFSGISIDSTGALWTSSNDSRVRTLSGTSWVDKTSDETDIGHVIGFADDNLWAFDLDGDRGGKKIRHWNGTTWTTTNLSFGLPAGDWRYDAIWGSAPNDIWVAAGKTIPNYVECHMLHWNGSTWTDSGAIATKYQPGNPTPIEGFTSVWGSGPDDVYATTGWSDTLWHFTNNTWTAIPNRGGWKVRGTGPNDVYVIGSGLHRWNGSTWTTVTLPDQMQDIWVNSPTDIWLTSWQSTGSSVYHYDGTFFVTFANHRGASFVGTSAKMFAFYQGAAGSGRLVKEWANGPGGTTQTGTSLAVDPGNGWVSPSGRMYLGGRGLLVHP